MTKVKFIGMIAAIISLSAFTISNSISWKIDEGHSVKFSGTEVEGIFKEMNGDINFDEQDLANSNFSVALNVASINTGNGTKNKHAVSEKWFDAETYPKITFTSSKISKSATGYQVEGTLEMHGVKKQITIPFSFSGNTFKGNLKVNRLDYGVGTMKGMSKKVSNEIAIEIAVPVVKA